MLFMYVQPRAALLCLSIVLFLKYQVFALFFYSCYVYDLCMYKCMNAKLYIYCFVICAIYVCLIVRFFMFVHYSVFINIRMLKELYRAHVLCCICIYLVPTLNNQSTESTESRANLQSQCESLEIKKTMGVGNKIQALTTGDICIAVQLVLQQPRL